MALQLSWSQIILSMILLGSLEGISAAITSACLLIISINDVIDIIICVFLFTFAFIFVFIAYKAGPDSYMKVCTTVGSVLMLLSGVSCILVDQHFVSESNSTLKSPLYAIISVSLLVNFTIDIALLLRLLKCGIIKDRLLTNNKQITYLLIVNVLLGLFLGFLFGFLDVEDKDDYRFEMTIITICSLIVGIICGCILAYLNEKETQTLEQFGLSPSLAAASSNYNRM